MPLPSRTALKRMIASAEIITGLGAGELRVHRNSTGDPTYVPVSQHGLFDAPTGADLFLDSSLIRKYFPYVTERALALLHTRRLWMVCRATVWDVHVRTSRRAR
jgi:hypothetical protein